MRWDKTEYRALLEANKIIWLLFINVLLITIHQSKLEEHKRKTFIHAIQIN